MIPDMEPSEEVRAVVLRFIDSMRDGDEQALSNRISRQPGFERFGSDPIAETAEHWANVAAGGTWTGGSPTSVDETGERTPRDREMQTT